jgi:murein DD-endopeptidase MepM/ murein hydrolase activator NlpD
MFMRVANAVAVASLVAGGVAHSAWAVCLSPIQGTVKIDSQILIDGVARPGVRVKVTSNVLSPAASLLGFDFSAPIDTHTDANGRIKGQYHVCGPLLVIHFAFRSDYNGDTKTYGVGQVSWNFNKTVNFTGAGAKSWKEPAPAPTVRFRMPVENPALIDIGKPVLNFMGGPFGLDHSPPPRGRSLSCVNYDGRGGAIGPPHCYGGHEGTDFMLKGGFTQMDKGGNWVVAAAPGKVIAVRQDRYDRCHAALYSSDLKQFFNIDCDGKNPGQQWNFVKIDHGKGVVSIYGHLKKNSVLVKEGDEVKCGQRLADIGSSGISSAPHLHFQVEVNGEVVDPFKGKLSRHSYWVEQGSGVIPAAKCQ